jgi:hypothetical protein
LAIRSRIVCANALPSMIFAATLTSSRALKTVSLHPPTPGAKTRPFPICVLGFDQILNVPRGYACGFASPAALLDDRFERPVR